MVDEERNAVVAGFVGSEPGRKIIAVVANERYGMVTSQDWAAMGLAPLGCAQHLHYASSASSAPI